MTTASNPDAAVEKVAAVLRYHREDSAYPDTCVCETEAAVGHDGHYAAHVAECLLASGALASPAEAETAATPTEAASDLGLADDAASETAVAVGGPLTEDEFAAIDGAFFGGYVMPPDLEAVIARIVAQRTAAAKAEALREAAARLRQDGGYGTAPLRLEQYAAALDAAESDPT